MEQRIKKIKSLLGANELDKAFEEIFNEFKENRAIINIARNLQNEYSRIKQEELQGILDDEKKELKRNRINKKLLDFLDQAENLQGNRGFPFFAEFIFRVRTLNYQLFYQTYKTYFLAGGGIILILLFVCLATPQYEDLKVRARKDGISGDISGIIVSCCNGKFEQIDTTNHDGIAIIRIPKVREERLYLKLELDSISFECYIDPRDPEDYTFSLGPTARCLNKNFNYY